MMAAVNICKRRRTIAAKQPAYAYDLSLRTSAATHALTNIFNADGSESHYAYDGYGSAHQESRLLRFAGMHHATATIPPGASLPRTH